MRHVETYSYSEDEASDYKSRNLFKSNPPFINNLLPSSKKARVKLNDDIEISMIIDSGSPINIIDKQTFENIQKQKRHVLKTTNRSIISYGCKKPLKLIGCFQVSFENNNRFAVGKIYVVNKRVAWVINIFRSMLIYWNADN